MQRRLAVVDHKAVATKALAYRTSKKRRFPCSRGVVRMHGENATLTYARGDMACGELTIEAGALKWRSGSCGTPPPGLREHVRSIQARLARRPAA